MKLLFDKLSQEVSKATTSAYSTSFSLGIYFLNKRLRPAIYAIYGFVRVADEIVDSFEEYNRDSLLQRFRDDAYLAIEEKISVNPILNSFQKAVHEYEIDHVLIETFLESMAMDLVKTKYNPELYNKYIVGSAEVVGLMCLKVFTEGDKTLYEELRPYAMKLGAAFQKVNFLRDMKDDYHILGRVYFPGVNFNEFGCEAKKCVELEIENDFRIALTGIRKLPDSSRGGVYLAYVYYQSLFRKIKRVSPDRLLSERIRITNRKKIGLMINSLITK